GIRGRRVQGRHQMGFAGSAKLVPYLDEGLRLGIAPGQAGLLEVVGPTAPLLAPLDRPIGHHAPVSQRVEDRDTRLRASRPLVPAAGARRLRRTAKSGTPGRRIDLDRLSAGPILVPQLDGEPSLDTPNARPGTGPLQGPKLTHGRNLQTLALSRSSW